MASLMELIERVNKGDLIDPAQLEIYQESSNSAETFLAHHAHAMLDLRRIRHLFRKAVDVNVVVADAVHLGEFHDGPKDIRRQFRVERTALPVLITRFLPAPGPSR